MKKLLLATAFCATASTAFAGSYTDPIVEPTIIIEDAASSASHQWLVPVTFILILLAVV